MIEMKKALVMKKLGMMQVFNSEGEVEKVTALLALENYILRKKSVDVDGYSALVVAYSSVKEEKLSMPERGTFKESKKYFRKLTELRLNNSSEAEVGTNLAVTIFIENEKVNVKGNTKGRGFTGCIKRHNFTIGPISHGSKHHRRGGSNGAGTGQGHVWKGQKMPGRYGNETITVKNLKIIKVLQEKNIILVKGSVPGMTGQILKVFN